MSSYKGSSGNPAKLEPKQQILLLIDGDMQTLAIILVCSRVAVPLLRSWFQYWHHIPFLPSTVPRV